MTTGQSLKRLFSTGKLFCTNAAVTGGRGSTDTNLTFQKAGSFPRTNASCLYKPHPQTATGLLLSPCSTEPEAHPALTLGSSTHSLGERRALGTVITTIYKVSAKRRRSWITRIKREAGEEASCPAKGRGLSHVTGSWAPGLGPCQPPQLTCPILCSVAEHQPGQGEGYAGPAFEEA